jgi:transketolase N-terminal domain/subunit
MARSLLDTADLAQLRTLAAQGPAVAVASVLVDSGLLQFDPDDPTWDDRDRLVVAGSATATAIEERLASAGARPADTLMRASGGDALAMAFGAAMASQLDGGAWRSWCVLDEAACDDGRVWEAARAAAWAKAATLTALVEGAGTVRLWEACGWTVHSAPADDPAWLLGALDQAVLTSPAVVLAVPGA